MPHLDPQTEDSKKFGSFIKISSNGLTLGRSVNGPDCFALPNNWLQVLRALEAGEIDEPKQFRNWLFFELYSSLKIASLWQILWNGTFGCSARANIAKYIWSRQVPDSHAAIAIELSFVTQSKHLRLEFTFAYFWATYAHILFLKIWSRPTSNMMGVQGKWFVKDLSRNGTLVNSIKLGKDNVKELKDGDEITVSIKSTTSGNAVHGMWDPHLLLLAVLQQVLEEPQGSFNTCRCFVSAMQTLELGTRYNCNLFWLFPSKGIEKPFYRSSQDPNLIIHWRNAPCAYYA